MTLVDEAVPSADSQGSVRSSAMEGAAAEQNQFISFAIDDDQYGVEIIVQIRPRQVGLLADSVLDIVSFEPTKIQPVPHISQGSLISFLSGLVTIDGAMLALIDLPNLLTATAAELKVNAALN